MRRGKGNGKMMNKCEFCGDPAFVTTKSGLKTKGRPTKLCQQCDKKAKDAIEVALEAFKTKLKADISKILK